MESTEHLISVSDLEGHPLHLLSMSGDEALGGPMAGLFEYHLEVASTELDIKAKDVLGKKLTVKILLPDETLRYFNGHVTSWSFQGVRNDRVIYHLILHPWLWLLNFTSDCRIFNQKSVPEIAQLIFRKYVEAEFDAKPLMAEYPSYEYLVQYRESDFNLICRLLQQEGIYFFFRHEAEKHTLVLADGLPAHSAVPGYETIPYRPPTTNARELEEHFDHCAFGQSIQTRSFRSLDYNFKDVRGNMLAFDEIPSQDRYSIGETFDYPGRYVEQSRGQTLASVRLEELHEPSQAIEVEGNPLGLGVGNLFTLANPPWADQPIDFLVTSAHYELQVPEESSTGHDSIEEPYRARYTLQPKSVQFRPARVATKPAILGPQTAIVVGIKKTADPDPEEIETDQYGRVRVRFHWERIGDRHPNIRGEKAASGTEDEVSKEEDNTCYVRVAQMWAGNRWGSIHIPRIGQEVVVEFLEGDPDRPLITGSVYNNVNMPPYTLPDNKTQSGIKSRSSKGGTSQNFNEIRFEDLKGKEELHIQAEKDMSTLVKHDQSTSVGANRSVSVGGNHSVSVTGTQSTTVTKDETQTYEANRKMTVTGTNTDEITGDHQGTYKAERTESVTGNDGLTVSKNKSVDVTAEYNSTAGKQYKVVQGDNIVFMKGSDIIVNNGKCEVSLSAGNATVTATSSLSLQCGSASITLKKDGSIEVNGEQKVALSGGGSTVGLEAAGATVAGKKVAVSGSTITEITGALIKIN